MANPFRGAEMSSKTPTSIAAVLAVGLLGLACSNSGLKPGGSSTGGMGSTGTETTGGSGGAFGTDRGTGLGPLNPLCGDGKLDPGEDCDDGIFAAQKMDPNSFFDDGCNALCQVEAGWRCPTPGKACIRCGADVTNGCDAGPPPYCGNGILEMNGGEQCDMGALNGVCLDNSQTPPDAGPGDPDDAGCPFGSWDFQYAHVCECPPGTSVFCTATCMIVWVDP
jgi:cysteine-rich repeat protein